MIKRFDKVKIDSRGSIYHNRHGVLVTITKKGNWRFNVCFGVDAWGNGIIGIFREDELISEETGGVK